jgi:hypothetical protein
MRTSRWSFVGLLACTLPSACADPCVDDGLGQDNCPTQNDTSATEGATESNTNTNTLSATMGSATMGSATMGMTGSQTADDTVTETAGGTLWCVDADGDGFGDPDMCTQSDDMPPGTVDNDDDCDDTNPDTFPGAAPNDDRRACMKDADGDDWGDDDPPPGVDPGTDCDDDDADVFPGAAENEEPRDLCTVDADGDGWGDANPPGGGGGGGPASGSDCYDENPALNPDTLQLTAFLPYNAGAFSPRTIQTVDPTNATLGDFIQLGTMGGGVPNVNIVTGTFNEDAEIYVNDLTGVQLYTVDYAKTCGDGDGTVAPVGDEPYGDPGDIVCGLEFGGNGLLYGIGHTGDNLRSFDRNTGEVADATPLTLDGFLLDVVSCGMARDCAGDRLLFANGLDHVIYSVETNGEVALVRDLSAEIPGEWNPTGLEYEPITRTVLLSTGIELYRVDINDTTVPPELIGMFEEDISNLQYLPICM